MEDTAHRAIAVVGLSAIMPDAPDAQSFWENIKNGRYSISEVPPERWDPGLYYDSDRKAPDKTYSKIGGWVREWPWEPYQWHLPIPPKIADAMDVGQKWAVSLAHAVLSNHGDGGLPLDRARTAVVLGNAMGGEQAYMTALRIYYPEFAQTLADSPAFQGLSGDVRATIESEIHSRFATRLPECTEDTMPGELSNCMAGRVANLFDLKGPNFVCDAACASALAAMDAAVEGLIENEYDAVLTGGVDRNMGASSFVKFCKIGALSATGTRPYADGADGFVMGEGGALFLLKRLADAERDGDTIYAVLRGVGGSSDGRGKGITAPNPVGQKLAVQRAWKNAGLDPSSVSLLEGHGTSTRVGDVVEFESLNAIFGANDLAPGSIALGSVKSNIGHLKSGAGAAGLFKAVMALHEKVLPPSLNFDSPNPNIDFSQSPIRVNTQLRPWDKPDRGDGVRRAAVSAFGFGGTNFHAVLEEYIPGRLQARRPAPVSSPQAVSATSASPMGSAPAAGSKAPLQGALVLGAVSKEALHEKLKQAQASGITPAMGSLPQEQDLRAAHRLAIAYQDGEELQTRLQRAVQAFKADQLAVWKALRSQGIFYGSGPAPKVAFLYTGQGSQYANMLAELRECEPVVAATFAEADRVMEPLIGRPLSDLIFVNPDDSAALEAADRDLRRTEITQPAVLTVDLALTRLFAAYGIQPDMVIGHSLGEYGALVASGALPFEDALQAVSARGRGMTEVAEDDNGLMAAVFAPLEQIRQVVDTIQGNVVIANINSNSQAVIGGATEAVQRAMDEFQSRGVEVAQLPVSHAFHTSIVAAASGPLRESLCQLRMSPPVLPLVSNVTGDFYPMAAGVEPQMVDMLAQQVASPVQFVKGLETLYQSGARVFLEVGPKKALQGFADDVLGQYDDVLTLFSNHPRTGEIASFNQALCGLYSAGLGVANVSAEQPVEQVRGAAPKMDYAAAHPVPATTSPATSSPAIPGVAIPPDRYQQMGQLFANFLEQSVQVFRGDNGGGNSDTRVFTAPVVTGAALGLPGTERVFDDANVQRILDGEQEIKAIPTQFRQSMVDKHITRLVKSGGGGPHFETIASSADVIKLAGRGGALDLEQDYGVPGERVEALDVTTQLAIAAGIDALRDAGIPLIMQYRTTHLGSKLPERWMLPEQLRDDTGVIFASAFPGYDSFADELTRYQQEHGRQAQLDTLIELRDRLAGNAAAVGEIEREIQELEQTLQREPYSFNRRFLFRTLPMGHSQMAEYIGARGPNTHINSACASTTQAFALAEDWIRVGRCRRVVIIAADDVTSDHLLEWVGSGFLASGAAATDEVVEEAALPFDRRRHGMILGMGACGVVVESPDAAAERGLRPICEVLSTVTANSAFHGTRLNIDHICQVMEKVVAQAEQRFGIDRRAMASELLFMSHETYTPARGGSASAEVNALRKTFGDAADRIVIANTKGLTGHAMGVGIEDTVAIKALETGVVPPVANFHEQDPELGPLNLSRGGAHPIRYALRLGAGFGSQISLSLMRWVPSADGSRPSPNHLGYEYRLDDPLVWQHWLQQVSGSSTPQLEVVQRTLRVQESLRAGQAEAHAPAVAEPVVAAVAPVAPASVAPPVVAEAAVSSPAAATDPVTEQVLAIVSKITGYPTDMLDPELDLEADLGIDTVKQAETFAAIREQYDIPRDENLQLRDYSTIARAVQFVHERRPDLAAVPATPVAAPTAAIPIPTSTPVAPAAATTGVDPVTEQVLAIVSKITGYPTDMLDPELDLEADLGIDTVKQAETFAAIREQYDIPRDENLQLRDYSTIARAVQFVHERRPDLAAETAWGAVAAPDASQQAPHGEATGSLPEGDMAATEALPRRIPVAMLRPPLELCRASGIELGEGSRVIVMPDTAGVAKALVQRLQKRGVDVLELNQDMSREQLTEQIDAWLQDSPVHGLYWLPALDTEQQIAQLTLAQWQQQLELRVKLLYCAARALYEQFGEPGRFMLVATRLGGRHGYDEEGALAPMGGAVSGFAKAYARERGDALVKAVDFAASRKTAAIADALLEETLHDAGAVEIGRCEERRWGVGLASQPAHNGGEGLSLDGESVFVVTGAAGSIVSAITADLAAVSAGTFYLLDLAPEPDPQNPDIRRLTGDREALKRDIFERLRAAGERATPALVEKQIAVLERSSAALCAIESIRNAGGTVLYRQLDLTRPDAVAAVITEVREAHGRIDVLLHAAGIEISHTLPDKSAREFDLVFDVKCDGWFNLLHAIADMQLGSAIVFSSIAGRFGNLGQTDYSAANDLLCKSISTLRRTHPATRGIAIDWTAWADIGMASRGSIPAMMAAAGIDMLAPGAGIPVIRHELTAGDWRGELVVAERLGMLLEARADTGGLDIEALGERITGPMIGRIVGMTPSCELQVETPLSPAEQPFLYDHQIDGTPVLPGVMAVEAFAELAALMFPSLPIRAVENVEFLAPLKFYRSEPHTLDLTARFCTEGEELVAYCQCASRRKLHGRDDEQVTTHFLATVRLGDAVPEAETVALPDRSDQPAIAAEDLYQVYFHGPAYQILDAAWCAEGRVVGQMRTDLPPNHQPENRTLILDPRLIELCFQTAGAWEIGVTGSMALPRRIKRLAMHTEPGQDIRAAHAVVTPHAGGSSFDAAVIDESGRVILALENYESIEYPGAIEESRLAPFRAAMDK
jgi:acyl transferase domain-containing protein/NAD(P)-dependent dehydrogenase (short-subunit alcohol dehydrogenase family)/acyl carrier protein